MSLGHSDRKVPEKKEEEKDDNKQEICTTCVE